MFNKSVAYFIILSIIGAISSCSNDDSASKKSEGTFTVLSYNIAGLPEPLSSSSPAKNTIFISEKMDNYDIVHAQEDFNYNDIFYSKANHPYRTEHLGGVPVGDGLSTLSKFPIYNFKRQRWAACNGTDCLTPKGFSYSQIKLDANTVVDFYNIHCNAGSSDPDLYARRKNILQIIAYIEKNSKGRPVILMGDTNTRYTRTGDNVRELLALGFKDVWIELRRGGEYPVQDGNALQDCEGKDPDNPGCEVVDKIFYRSGDGVTLTPIEFEVLRDEFLDADGNWLSDHMPHYAKFSFSTSK